MPVTKSAKKALRQNLKRREQNVERKKRLKKAIKILEKIVKEGKIKEAEKQLSLVYKIADKTAKAKVIHKNKSGRVKKQSAHLLSKVKSKRAVS